MNPIDISDDKNLEAIAAWVPNGARVLDLGCGDGRLLDLLHKRKGCRGYGVDINDANVLACARRGVDVLQFNLDEGLSMFADQSFDVVLQVDTLQHLRNARVMLSETVRVGRSGIVAFPNFGHWPNRMAVLGGRMPVNDRLPYEWYDTPNIRVGTFHDFQALANELGLRVEQACGLHRGQVRTFWPNALASTALFKVSAH